MRINEAQAELNEGPEPNMIGEAEVYAVIDYLGDAGSALNGGNRDTLAELYESLGLRLAERQRA